MTAPTRYRGQPVSEGIGTGAIYLGDAPGVGPGLIRDPDEGDVRAAFAAVARERAALAARLRDRGQDLQADIVDIGALIAADPALIGPAIDAVRAGADGIAAVGRPPRPRPPCSPRCPTPTWPSAPATSARWPRPCSISCAGPARRAARGKVHPGPPRGRPGRPHPAGRGADWPARSRSRAGPARTRRSSRAVSACPCWPEPTRRCWPRAAGHHAILDSAAGELIVDPPAAELAWRACRPAPRRTAGPRRTSGRPTASRSRCCATSPRPPKPGSACPAARPASACCAPRSPSPAPPAGRRRPITWPS